MSESLILILSTEKTTQPDSKEGMHCFSVVLVSKYRTEYPDRSDSILWKLFFCLEMAPMWCQ